MTFVKSLNGWSQRTTLMGSGTHTWYGHIEVCIDC